eukprot:422345_1
MTSKSGGIQPKTKKELLKLSKPQLIRIGKKQKVTTTGSKLQIIDRILKSTSKKNDKKSTIKNGRKSTINRKIVEHKASNILSKAQRELLIHGYVNKINKYNYPNILIVILSEYIGTMCLKFDICPNKYLNNIIKNGRIIRRKTYQYIQIPNCSNLMADRYTESKYVQFKNMSFFNLIDMYFHAIVYASSYIFNYCSINKWSIQIKKNKTYDRIGIISDIVSCRKNCRLMDIDCNSYYIYPDEEYREGNSYVIAKKLLKNDKVKKVYNPYSYDAKFDGRDANLNAKYARHYDGFTISYGCANGKKAWLCDYGVVEKRIRKQIHSGWCKDDIITLILDSKNWKLKFIVNGKHISALMDVEKDTYYAAIGSITNSAQFVLL